VAAKRALSARSCSFVLGQNPMKSSEALEVPNVHSQGMIESSHPYAVDAAAAICRRRRLRESSHDFS
jgi:hypothetical protein